MEEVWVTLSTTDSEAKASLVFVNSLQVARTRLKSVVVVSLGVSPLIRQLLSNDFDHVIILEEDRNWKGLALEEFGTLVILGLQSSSSFTKIVFVDPHSLILKNSDEIFHLLDDHTDAIFLDNGAHWIFGLKPTPELYNHLLSSTNDAQEGDGSIFELLRTTFLGTTTSRGGTPRVRYFPGESIPLVEDFQSLETINFHVVTWLGKEKGNNFSAEVLEQNLNGSYPSLQGKRILETWKGVYDTNEDRLFAMSESPLLMDVVPSPHLSLSSRRRMWSREPIAIVGMGCRLPGSNNLDEFWQVLVNGVDATGAPPPSRWSPDQCCNNNYSKGKGSSKSVNAGFLKGPVDQLDGHFFGISPKELLSLDPQHRLLLEVVWEALEHAGIDAEGLRGSNGGVFMGPWTNDYRTILEGSGHTEIFRNYMGNSIGAGAARISHVLGLTGPSIATESGCSSSMVAVHLALKSLLSGETDLALACGVNLLLNPFDESFMPSALSPEGRCKTFDAKADGFARAEGCGVLVLKRLSTAVKDNDRLWALIRGSGVAQEGLSRSMGTPTVETEAQAMRVALRDAGVHPAQVSYVETHGTGTVVGDPIEVAAMAKAYYSTERKEPLLIGSVKTNVGHTESCSGITGIIKVVLALTHELLPPHFNFRTLNPAVNLSAVPAEIVLQARDWKRDQGKPRIAGVSSFGITGTDAHVVLQEAPLPDELQPDFKLVDLERPLHLIKISAKTEAALDSLTNSYANFLETTTNEEDFVNFAYTANVGRSDFPCRAVVVASSSTEAIENISKSKIARSTGDLGLQPGTFSNKICFLYPGQRSGTTPGLEKQLYELSPTFRTHFDHCLGLLWRHHGIHLRSPTLSTSSSSDCCKEANRMYSNFCLQIALSKLWNSWGVKADYVLGVDLSGELAAAVGANLMELQDAVKMLVRWGQRFHDEDGEAEEPQPGLTCDEPKRIKIIGERSIISSTAQVGHISGVSGSLVDISKMNPQYWTGRCASAGVNNQVGEDENKFEAARQVAIERGVGIFIGIGSGPDFLVNQHLRPADEPNNVLYVSSLLGNSEDDDDDNVWTSLLNSLATLYVSGRGVNWTGFEDGYSSRRRKVTIPNYPFSKKSYWPELQVQSSSTELRRHHPLVGSRIPNASSITLFQSTIDLVSVPYLGDHVIGSQVILPGACYLEMCLVAGHYSMAGSADSTLCADRRRRRRRAPLQVENMMILAPLQVPPSGSVTLQTVVRLDNNAQSPRGGLQVQVDVFHQLDSGKWLKHATASTSYYTGGGEGGRVVEPLVDTGKLAAALASPPLEGITKGVYSSTGKEFGDSFVSLESGWRLDDLYVFKVKRPEEGHDGPAYMLHPILSDAMLQSLLVAGMDMDKVEQRGRVVVPIEIGRTIWFEEVLPPGGDEKDEPLYTYVQCPASGGDEHEARVVLTNGRGSTVFAMMEGVVKVVTTAKALHSVLQQQSNNMPQMWEEEWRKVSDWGMAHRLEGNILLPEKKSATTTGEEEFHREFNREFGSLSQKTQETKELLEEYVYLSMLHCLYERGWKPVPRQDFLDNELFVELGLVEGFRHYFKYILEVLREEGIISRRGEPNSDDCKKVSTSWIVEVMPPLPETVQGSLDRLKSKLEDDRFPAVWVLELVDTQLANVLGGHEAPQRLLFSSSTTTERRSPVEALYEDYFRLFELDTSISSVVSNRFRHWLSQLEEDGGRRRSRVTTTTLRILEVGGGEGMATKLVLEALEESGFNYEYTFTDISSSFLSSAEKKFDVRHGSSIMTFQKLDIENDPISQGFCPEHYDYIVACGVLHATRDVREALQNVAVLLRPDGNLDVCEQTKVNRMLTSVFGLLEGYWRFTDFDLRPSHCVLSAEGWESAMSSTGFIVQEPYSVGDVMGIMPFCVGKRGYTTTTTGSTSPSPPIRPVWIVFYEDSPAARDSALLDGLIAKLTRIRRQVVIVRAGNSFQTTEAGLKYTVRETVIQDYDQLLQNIVMSVSGKRVVEGVLYGWAMNPSRTSQTQLLQPLLYITQRILLLLNPASQPVVPRLICLLSGSGGGAPVVGDFEDLAHFHAATIFGFVKSLNNEQGEMVAKCVDVANWSDTRLLEQVFAEIWTRDDESRVLLQGGAKYVPKLMSHKPLLERDLELPHGSSRFQLILPESKLTTDLEFGPLQPYNLEGNEVEVEVAAASLNLRDAFSILKPSEKFRDVNAVGVDFAGRVVRLGAQVSKWKVGDSVFGLKVNNALLPSHNRAHEDELARVPPAVTLCEAATLPTVFSTAYHCLVDVAQVGPEDTVLIHTASGGVGLITIQLLRNIGVKEIIVTAGSGRKRNYLRGLGLQHIFSSRDTSFARDILEVTAGVGVNVVLNTLTSEGFKEASLAACARGARFIEISKLGIWEVEEVAAMRPDVDYRIEDVSALEKAQRVRLTAKMGEMLERGLISPLPYTRFGGGAIREGLGYLQKAKHIGKVVMAMPEVVQGVGGGPSVTTPLFNDRSTYLVTGGTGGIGFEVAKWMLTKGARYIILAGRRPPEGRMLRQIEAINREHNQPRLLPIQVNIEKRDEVAALLSKIKSREIGPLPPLRGVMHAAGTLSDGFLRNQTWEKFEATFKAKVDGTLVLHEATLRYPLEHFVLFSSATALIGGTGQANHSAGNCFQDALAAYRRSVGLPGTSINWGIWGEVGIAADKDIAGMAALSNVQGVTALEYILSYPSLPHPPVPMNMDSFAKLSQLFPVVTNYVDQGLLRGEGVALAQLSNEPSNVMPTSSRFWLEYDEFQSEMSHDGKVAFVHSHVIRILKRLLNLDEADVLAGTTNLQELGVDSLNFIEIKNMIQELVGDRVTISSNLIRSATTVSELGDLVSKMIEGGSLPVVKTQVVPSFESVSRLIREDCQLPAQICARGRLPLEIKAVRTVLLTGVTGTLGVYLLKELCSKPEITKVICLIRTRAGLSLEARLAAALHRAGLEEDEVDSSKVVCLEGDVCLDKLGLKEAIWEQLCGEVDAVFHSAARVDHTEFYHKGSKVREANVEGLKRILELCSTGRDQLKRLYTASSFFGVATTEEANGRVSESWPNVGDFDGLNIFAYSVSKFVCDLLAKEAVVRGLPVKVFRFPSISGNSNTGKCIVENNHLMMRFLHVMKTGTFHSLPLPLAVIPVDKAAECSASLFFNERTPSDIYNIAHPHPPPEQELIGIAAEKFGRRITNSLDLAGYVRSILDYSGDSPYMIFRDCYHEREEQCFAFQQGNMPAVRGWMEVKDFWVSPKILAFAPSFYSKLDPVAHYVEQDLRFAKETGWFEKFGMQNELQID